MRRLRFIYKHLENYRLHLLFVICAFLDIVKSSEGKFVLTDAKCIKKRSKENNVVQFDEKTMNSYFLYFSIIEFFLRTYINKFTYERNIIIETKIFFKKVFIFESN